MAHNLRRRLVWVGLLLFCAIAVAVFFLQTPDTKDLPPAKSLQKASLRLKWVIYSSFAHHFVAKEKGFYAAEGVQLEIRPGGASIDPVKLVASGEDIVGLASYAQVLLARAKGVPVIAVGEEYITSGVVSLSLADSGIAKPEDFAGKRIGWIPGSDTGTVYEALMAKQRIDRSTIKEIPIGFDLGVFLNRQVDVNTVAFITNQVIAVQAKGFKVNIIDPGDYGINPGGNVFITSEAALREHRAVVKGILRGSLRGIVNSQQMPDQQVVDIVLRYNPDLDQGTELKVWKATKDKLLQKNSKIVGIMPEHTWTHTADLFHKYGGLETVPPIRDCFTNSLVEEILREGL